MTRCRFFCLGIPTSNENMSTIYNAMTSLVESRLFGGTLLERLCNGLIESEFRGMQS